MINISIPPRWKAERENLARIYSVEEGETITLIQYHILWCPKFRFSVLKGNVEVVLKQILQKICEDYRYSIKVLEVRSDHIHIVVDVPQTVAYDVIRTGKSISAIELFKAFPQ